MCAAKAITRVAVPHLCCLWAETPAAPMNIALIGIFDGGALTGPCGQVRLAAIQFTVSPPRPITQDHCGVPARLHSADSARLTVRALSTATAPR